MRGEPRKASPRGEHSAEYDVAMSWQVLLAASEKLAVSAPTYKHVSELLERTGLEHYAPLFSVNKKAGGSLGQLAPNEVPPAGRSSSSEGWRGLEEPASLSSVLGDGGLLAKNWAGFVPRQPQQQMAEAVATTLEEGGVSLLEAPTGSGKTVAYLTPLFLKKSQGTLKKAVISTHTKHLQDQLITNDVPALQQALGVSISVAVLKGRRNYLCIRRLGHALDRADIQPDEAWILIKTLLWLEQGGSGDLDRLNISHQGSTAALHADSLVCRRSCARAQETACPYQRALRAAEAADVVIVNHALLADPSFITRWPLEAVIVDEAHHLESVVRRATAAPLHASYLQDIVSPLLTKRPKDSTTLRHVRIEAQGLVADYRTLLLNIRGFTDKHTQEATLRLTAVVRHSSRWGTIEKSVEQWSGRCQFIIGLLESMTGNSPEHSADALSAAEAADIRSSLQEFLRDLALFVHGAPDRIQWVELDRERDTLYLNDVALSIVPYLQRLYTSVRSVIFTSATLTTAGNFSYIKDLLGIPFAAEVILPSSFPLKDNLCIYLVDDAPDPRTPAYDTYVGTQIVHLSLLLGGRTLGLFTSLKSTTTVFNMLIRPLNKAKIKLYAQGHTGGKTNMLKRFRDTSRSVLLGTDSFWEGVDIPGDTLSCVVIAKLPFAPPWDPVVEAVAETLGVDSFQSTSLPRMILKLRQGIGRLIRRHNDRGVVVILDSRLHRSMYGDLVIQSLPPGRVKIGSTAELSGHIKDWLGEDVVAKWSSE